ncbi:MAG: Spore coat associated protein JA (CotJA) [Lachnoclostridium sp.]
MNLNFIQADLKITPKDCSQNDIPTLSCDSGGNFPFAPSLAMAYIPIQQFKDLYDPEYALKAGTIFKELDLPFYGTGGALL